MRRYHELVVAHSKDLGYDVLTAWAITDRDGSPLAPLCLELRADDHRLVLHAARERRRSEVADSQKGDGTFTRARAVSIQGRIAEPFGAVTPWVRIGRSNKALKGRPNLCSLLARTPIGITSARIPPPLGERTMVVRGFNLWNRRIFSLSHSPGRGDGTHDRFHATQAISI